MNDKMGDLWKVLNQQFSDYVKSAKDSGIKNQRGIIINVLENIPRKYANAIIRRYIDDFRPREAGGSQENSM